MKIKTAKKQRSKISVMMKVVWLKVKMMILQKVKKMKIQKCNQEKEVGAYNDAVDEEESVEEEVG